MGTSFQEIEHKFVVGSDFDAANFFKKLRSLDPKDISEVSVRDTYFVLKEDRQHVFRHRFDKEIQQLTVKSVELDSAVRTEINLPIDQSAGDQLATVRGIMKILGLAWQGELGKEIQVAYFDDCEVVFYKAWTPKRTVYCVEFEALSAKSVEEAFAVLERYENKLGFSAKTRENKSLFELLLLEDAPSDVRAMLTPRRT